MPSCLLFCLYMVLDYSGSCLKSKVQLNFPSIFPKKKNLLLLFCTDEVGVAVCDHNDLFFLCWLVRCCCHHRSSNCTDNVWHTIACSASFLQEQNREEFWTTLLTSHTIASSVDTLMLGVGTRNKSSVYSYLRMESKQTTTTPLCLDKPLDSRLLNPIGLYVFAHSPSMLCQW